MIYVGKFVQCDIALGLEQRYGVRILEVAHQNWRAVGDIAVTVCEACPSLDRAEVLTEIQQLLSEGYCVPLADLAPEADMFGKRLQLDDRFGWVPGLFQWKEQPGPG